MQGIEGVAFVQEVVVEGEDTGEEEEFVEGARSGLSVNGDAGWNGEGEGNLLV